MRTKRKATATKTASTATAPDALAEKPDKTDAAKAFVVGDALIDNALGYDAGNDIEQIPSGIRDASLTFLQILLGGGRYRSALEQSHLQPWQVSQARNASKRFKSVMDAAREARALNASMMIEDKLADMALGDCPLREGYLAPDTKAAQLLLAAHDPKYRPGMQSPVTSVNIQVNGLPL